MRRALQWTLTLLMIAITAIPASAGWEEGVAAYKSKNYQAAVNEFQELVRQTPDGYRGHYMLGLSLQSLNRREEALQHLRKAYDLNPSDLNSKFALGRAYHGLKRYGDVAKLLGTIDSSSFNAQQQIALYQMRGDAKFRSKDVSGAVSDFQKLAKLKPNDAQIQYMLGTTTLSLGRTDEAIAALAKASSLAPSDKDKKRAYVQALIKKGRSTRDKNAKKSSYGKATTVAKELVAADGSYDNYMLLVSAELGAGRYEDAIASGKTAISKKDSDWLAHYYLGQAYSSAKQYSAGEAPLNAALERVQADKDRRLVYTQLGYVYEKQKKYSQSIKAYETAGDAGSAARVRKNEETDKYNDQVESENKKIEEMKAEAEKLEKELENLEGGGGV